MARHPNSWVDKFTGKTIIFPYSDLNAMYASDIVQHFQGASISEGKPEDLNSGILLFLPASQAHSPNYGKFCDHGDLELLRHLSTVGAPIDLAEGTYSGMHLMRPGTCFITATPYHKKEKKELKRLEKEEPSRNVVCYTRTVNIQSAGFLKYSYGTVELRRFPLLRSCKLLAVDGAGGSYSEMSLDDGGLSPSSTEVPLASNFGQVTLVVIFTMPLSCKFQLLKLQADDPSVYDFTLPHGPALKKPDLAMICIVEEVTTEVFNCSRKTTRMDQFVQEVTGNMAAYQQCGTTVLKGLKLMLAEISRMKTKYKFPEMIAAMNTIVQQAEQVKRAFIEANISSNNLEDFPSFSALHDADRVHRPNQHWVEDGRWNLPNC